MRRIPVWPIVAAALVVGCGGGDEPSAERTPEPAPASDDCATSKRSVAVRDVVRQLPRGTRLVPAKSEFAKEIAAEYRKGGADPVDVQEVRRDAGGENAVVAVANVKRTGTEAEVLEGLREAAQEEDARFREVRVGGRRAGLISAPGVAQVGALVGPCAVISITDTTVRRALEVARGLRPL